MNRRTVLLLTLILPLVTGCSFFEGALDETLNGSPVMVKESHAYESLHAGRLTEAAEQFQQLVASHRQSGDLAETPATCLQHYGKAAELGDVLARTYGQLRQSVAAKQAQKQAFFDRDHMRACRDRSLLSDYRP